MEDVVVKKPKEAKLPGVEDLDPRETQEVLRRLWNRGGKVGEAVLREIEQYLRSVEVEEVAERVFSDLDLLTREDLWDRSGKTSRGYNHPADVAWEMVEEVIRPYLGEVDRYWRSGMREEAFRCCLGLLIGVYDFQMESDSSFKEWAQDDPHQAFCWVRDEWTRKVRDQGLTDQLESQLSERCPEWA